MKRLKLSINYKTSPKFQQNKTEEIKNYFYEDINIYIKRFSE